MQEHPCASSGSTISRTAVVRALLPSSSLLFSSFSFIVHNPFNAFPGVGLKFGLNGAFFYGAEAVGDCVLRNQVPKPYTLHPTPTPYTLHPTPYTIHPTTYTLHPIYICVCVYMYMYVCIYIYPHKPPCAGADSGAARSVRALPVRRRIYIYMYIYVHIYICMYIYVICNIYISPRAQGLTAVPREVYGHFQYVVGLDLSHNKIESVPKVYPPECQLVNLADMSTCQLNSTLSTGAGSDGALPAPQPLVQPPPRISPRHHSGTRVPRS